MRGEHSHDNKKSMKLRLHLRICIYKSSTPDFRIEAGTYVRDLRSLHLEKMIKDSYQINSNTVRVKLRTNNSHKLSTRIKNTLYRCIAYTFLCRKLVLLFLLILFLHTNNWESLFCRI